VLSQESAVFLILFSLVARQAQNPSGLSMSQRRLDEIYEVCCEHDVMILEDDSYYYLTFQTEKHRGMCADR